MELVGRITGTKESADARKFEFTDASGKRYVIWVWKGDYFALGAGTEIGIYTNPVSIGDLKHWQASTDTPLKMTVGVTYKDGTGGYTFSPAAPVFWNPVFDPSHQGYGYDDMTVTHTLDFTSQQDIGRGFYEAYKSPEYGWDFVIDPVTKEVKSATYIW